MTGCEKRIVLAAGGTGGHVFPAQALAQELMAQGMTVFIFTDGRGSQFNDGSFSTVKIPADQLQGSLGKKIKGGGSSPSASSNYCSSGRCLFWPHKPAFGTSCNAHCHLFSARREYT
ncbi:MAG: glycosyltransferase [Proteobacteria bacterium]|nr:glycosyltransferase [Pseudomonadota bacterium]